MQKSTLRPTKVVSPTPSIAPSCQPSSQYIPRTKALILAMVKEASKVTETEPVNTRTASMANSDDTVMLQIMLFVIMSLVAASTHSSEETTACPAATYIAQTVALKLRSFQLAVCNNLSAPGQHHSQPFKQSKIRLSTTGRV